MAIRSAGSGRKVELMPGQMSSKLVVSISSD
jgi:hypothetical protein